MCWSMAGARAQAVERWLRTRVEETWPEPQVVLAWPAAAPLMEQQGCNRGRFLSPPENTAKHREAGCPGALLGPGQMLGFLSWPERKLGSGCLVRDAKAEPREGR